MVVSWIMPLTSSSKTKASLLRPTTLTKELTALATPTKTQAMLPRLLGMKIYLQNSESALLEAVASQPISVAIDAGGSDFSFTPAVFILESVALILTMGLLLSYGTSDDGTKYWLVKNSWGTSWGEEGYIRMQRDVDAQEGLCRYCNASFLSNGVK